MKKYVQMLLVCLLFLFVCKTSLEQAQEVRDIEQQANLQPSLNYTLVPNENICIDSKHSFAYQTSGEMLAEPESPPVLPPKPWLIETELPIFPDNSMPSTRKNWILGVFPGSDGSWNIWILRSWSNDPIKGGFDSMGILVYNTDSKHWTKVPAYVKGTQSIVGELFMTQDGTIWAHNYRGDFVTIFEPPYWIGLAQLNTLPSYDLPLFSMYNENEDQFEPVKNVQIPASQIEGEWNKVLLDKNGVFWVLVQGDGIYSYSPNTQKVDRHVDLSTGILKRAVKSVFIDSANNIFFSDDSSAVFRFSIDTSSIEKVGGIPLPLDGKYDLSFHGILVDHSKRLWIGNTGWAEPDEYRTWYQLFPSPIFVTPSEGDTLYAQQKPRLTIESIDGKLWYQFNDGIAWLDPKEEKWCWFTTERSNVIEDQQHNLWIVAENTLYKYPLYPYGEHK